MSGSDTVSENPRIRTVKYNDEKAGHAIAAFRICQRRAYYAREYGLEGIYREMIEEMERA